MEDKMRLVVEEDVYIGMVEGRLTERRQVRGTGEVLSERPLQRKKLGLPGGGRNAHYYKVYRTNWVAFTKLKGATSHLVGVLWRLVTYLGWETGYLVHPESKSPLSEGELAKMIGVSRAGLHNDLVSLEKLGVVAVIRPGNRAPNVIYVNPNLVYFGKFESENPWPGFTGTFKPKVLIQRRNRQKQKEG